MSKMYLLCIPYAGGSAMFYKQWQPHMDPEIEIVPLELPGRGTRFGESLYATLDEAMDDILNMAGRYLHGSYSLFGHSMGALLAFELCHRLLEKHMPLPDHLFVSGKSAPHLTRDSDYKYLLPDNEFMEMIFSLGGTPRELLENQELLNLFVPIIKADYKIVETYCYHWNRTLPIRMTVLYGKHDNGRIGSIKDWDQHAGLGCHYAEFDGGHFFIHDHVEGVTKVINSQLKLQMPPKALNL